MIDVDDLPPLSERLTGAEHANKYVMDQLDEEESQIPGPFTYLACIAIYGALFWAAFNNNAATIALTLLPVLILSYDADRRRSSIKVRRAIERQNGIIRSLFAHQQHAHASLLNIARGSQDKWDSRANGGH